MKIAKFDVVDHLDNEEGIKLLCNLCAIHSVKALFL